jgi:hypothetical protein
MGGWMTYQRMRHRNNLLYRKPAGDRDPYWHPGSNVLPSYVEADQRMLIGDLNRMEQDYLDPQYPEPPFARRPEGSDPSAEVAKATGVDIETVRKVLRHVFMEQR